MKNISDGCDAAIENLEMLNNVQLSRINYIVGWYAARGVTNIGIYRLSDYIVRAKNIFLPVRMVRGKIEDCGTGAKEQPKFIITDSTISPDNIFIPTLKGKQTYRQRFGVKNEIKYASFNGVYCEVDDFFFYRKKLPSNCIFSGAINEAGEYQFCVSGNKIAFCPNECEVWNVRGVDADLLAFVLNECRMVRYEFHEQHNSSTFGYLHTNPDNILLVLPVDYTATIKLGEFLRMMDKRIASEQAEIENLKKFKQIMLAKMFI